MKYQNPNCDGSGPCSCGPVKVLPTDGDGNAILCLSCFNREIGWRMERNKELGEPNRFDLPTFESLRVYETE